jgi:hypothetical protein
VAADLRDPRERPERERDTGHRDQPGGHPGELGGTARSHVRQRAHDHPARGDHDHLQCRVDGRLLPHAQQQRVAERARGGDRGRLTVAGQRDPQQLAQGHQAPECHGVPDLHDADHGRLGDGRDREQPRGHDDQHLARIHGLP